MITLATAPLDPGWAGLGLAMLLMLAVLVAAAWVGVGMWRDGLVATARTSIQLLGIGYVLNWIFKVETFWAIVAVLLTMTFVAGWTGSRRVERALAGTGQALTLVLLVVLSITLLYVTQAVIGVDGVDPRYLIPLGGMILGNAMTAGSLAAQRFHESLREDRDRLEAALGLGASPKDACRDALSKAFRAALTPTLNAMMIVGIVKLPGVMTGQMLGGSPPLEAAKYQIVVMFMLAFSDGLTALGVLLFLRRQAFDEAWRLRAV
ncbi:MAG: iron export ABC transporter permease subunit FetB [Planctomycetes bacterium]|nr:iron export ABC transporter permease subunit FetB [Planctomycetota bacterium]